MSYILDALTKAAQQRERQVPVVQRLLSPAPAPRSPRARLGRGVVAALALGAGLLVVLLVWWLRPVPGAAPPDPAAVIATPRAPVAEPSRAVRLEPPPRLDTQVEKPVPVEKLPVETPVPGERKTKADAPRAPGPVHSESRASASVPQSAPAVAPPVAPAAPASPSDRAGLKLEALIYSDVPAQRMVFINGRRYAEGEMIDGRLRVEEINEEGVELSDQGRRFTLRVAR